MLIPCLWTTLPWIVLGQTYYMSFIFNNYGYGVRPATMVAPDLGLPGPKKPAKQVDETLELSSMEHSRESNGHGPRPIVDNDDTIESDGSIYENPPPVKIKKPKLKPKPKRKPSKATETQKTSKAPGTQETTKTPGNPGAIKCPESTQATETADTPETAKEITTETTKATEMGEGEAAPVTDQPESGTTTDEWETLGPGDKGTTLPTIAPRAREVTFPPVTPHPPEFFEYPLADCHEEMDLHEVFGISLERDRGLATKILCRFNNSWGGPWLLMTRVELPVRIHMRHWFLGYVTEDYKDLNINFLGLAHIMNHMRTAMLILGQDDNDRLVYNLYDDVVISAFNDVFMMRKAELVEANATDMLFLAVGKTLSSYAGRNRTCPLQVLGSWWGNTVRQAMNDGFSCVFPRERNVSHPGYMAIFIKPSLFKNNNTALYNRSITTRRPWGLTVDAGLMEEVKNNKTEYDIRLDKQFLRTRQIVQDELFRRARIYDAIEKVRRMENEMQRGR